MKRIVFTVVISLFFTEILFAQYSLYRANNISKQGISVVHDTVYQGQGAIKAWYTPGTNLSPTPSVTWKKVVTLPNAPALIRWMALVPSYADAPMIVFSFKGNGQSTTIFTQLQNGGWQQYSASMNLWGFSADTMFVGIASSDLSGMKVVFLDNIEAVYSDGSSIVVESGGDNSDTRTLTTPTFAPSNPPNGATVTNPVTFVWNPTTGAVMSYLLQTSPTADFSGAVVDHTTTATTLSLTLSTGTTYYRLKAIAANSANNSQWSEVRSVIVSTTSMVSMTPTLSAPSNGAVTGQNPTVSCSAIPGATYGLQVSTVSDFSNTVVNLTGLTSNSYQLTNLSPNTTYYWRMNSVEPGKTVSLWSSVWTFNTGTSGTTLNPPTIGSPTNGATNFPVDGGQIIFTLPQGGTAVEIELREGSINGTVILSQVYSSSPIVLNNLKHGTTYFFRLRTIGNSAIGNWSGWISFSTASQAYTAPTNLSPADGMTGVILSPSFVWTVCSNAAVYEYQISELSSFQTVAISGNAQTNYVNLITTHLKPNTSYWWRVRAVYSNGTSVWSSPWRFTTGNFLTPVDEDSSVPTEFKLNQNYPNPFNPTTSIKYTIASIQHVKLAVYDVLGREVATLVNKEQGPGTYEVKFDASKFSAGMYIYTIQAGEYSASRKMILIK